ncbi:MAG: Na/Pi symporter [Verrucomicrobiota bacterium]
MEIFALILAGLGFYFIGVGGIRTSLQQIPGRRFRELIGGATRHPLRAAFTGYCTGAVTQTSIGVSVILAGLVARGVVTLSQALPVVAWSNVGLVALVFLSSLPVHLFAMALIGICGICLNYNFGGRFRGFMGPLFSLGMLLFGLRLLKESFAKLAVAPGFESFIAATHGFHLLPFLLGALLRIPIQSTSAVALLGVILHEAGIFSESQALLVLYGTALGTGLATFTLTSHLKGVMRQITLFEAIINGVGGLVLLVVYYLEHVVGWPLLQHAAASLADDFGMRFAYVFLVQQLLCVGVAYALLPRAPIFLERLAPTTREQDLSRPRFIHDEAAQDIETGLSLAERELAGLLDRLPDYLPSTDPGAPHHAPGHVTMLHNATLAVLRELDSFLAALSDKRNKTHATSVAILQAKRRVDLVMGIEDGVHELARCLDPLTVNPATKQLVLAVVDSLDAQLRTVIDAATSRTDEDLALLSRITRSSAESVERVRRTYLGAERDLDHATRLGVLALTSQYERVVWGLHHFSRSLTSSTET